MAPTIVENNSDRLLKRSLEERRKRRSELGLKTVVDNTMAGTLLYVKVVAVVYTPFKFSRSILNVRDAKQVSEESFKGLPQDLRETPPLDGQWLVRQAVQINQHNYRVEARIGLHPLRLTDMTDVQAELARAEYAAYALTEAWALRGWEASHRAGLVRHVKDVPPDWFVNECKALKLTINVEHKALRDLP